MHRLASLTALALLIVSSVSASPIADTYDQPDARHPTPTQKINSPGKPTKPLHPTHTSSTPTPSQTCTNPTRYWWNGRVAVLNTQDGSQIGWFQDTASYPFAGSDPDDTRWSVRYPVYTQNIALGNNTSYDYGVAYNLIYEDHVYSPWSLIGAVGNGYLRKGSPSFVYVGGTTDTGPRGSPPSLKAQNYLGGKNASESSIWAFNCDLKLEVHYTNWDHSHIRPSIIYDQQNDFIGLTGDLEAYNKRHNATAIAVDLQYMPNPGI